MQGMRSLLRNSLARSLRSLPEEDRLAAALPVVCGSALAAHCTVNGLDGNQVLHLRISSSTWLAPLLGMKDVLQRDLAATAGVVLHGIDLQVVSPARGARPPVASPGLPRTKKGSYRER